MLGFSGRAWRTALFRQMGASSRAKNVILLNLCFSFPENRSHLYLLWACFAIHVELGSGAIQGYGSIVSVAIQGPGLA